MKVTLGGSSITKHPVKLAEFLSVKILKSL